MIIPLDALAPEVLDNIIKEFVLQEGTDYGAEDVDFDAKLEQVKLQLANGSAVIVYSELHETVNIMPADQFQE